MVAFVVFALACLYGLLPRGGWVFELTGEAILQKSSVDGMTSMQQVYEDLAKWQDEYFTRQC